MLRVILYHRCRGSRPTVFALLATICLTGLSGCRTGGGAFQIDSNSRMPWFGLNLTRPKPSAARRTLETISDRSDDRAPGQSVGQASIRLAEETRVQAEPASPPRSLMSRLVGKGPAAIPAPPEKNRPASEQTIRLEGPREEFR